MPQFYTSLFALLRVAACCSGTYPAEFSGVCREVWVAANCIEHLGAIDGAETGCGIPSGSGFVAVIVADGDVIEDAAVCVLIQPLVERRAEWFVECSIDSHHQC